MKKKIHLSDPTIEEIDLDELMSEDEGLFDLYEAYAGDFSGGDDNIGDY